MATAGGGPAFDGGEERRWLRAGQAAQFGGEGDLQGGSLGADRGDGIVDGGAVVLVQGGGDFLVGAEQSADRVDFFLGWGGVGAGPVGQGRDRGGQAFPVQSWRSSSCGVAGASGGRTAGTATGWGCRSPGSSLRDVFRRAAIAMRDNAGQSEEQWRIPVRVHLAVRVGARRPGREDSTDPLGLLDLTTHSLPLGDAPKGYESFQDKADGCVKVVLKH